jgi:alanine racemase
MNDNTYIELSQQALQNNIRFLQKMLGKTVKISSVVKGNAYGHGITEFAGMLYKCGIRHFSVFSADEAFELRAVLDDVEIMIMGNVEGDMLEWAITEGIDFYVFDIERLSASIQFAKKIKSKAKIHIEVETGMNRTGFNKKDLPAVISLLKKSIRHIDFKGLCTHYSGAESIANYYRIKSQIAAFAEISERFKIKGLIPQQYHTACSAASVMYPETRMDMVRIGILQYGLWPSPETFIHYLADKKSRNDPLRRILTWKSSIMSVKEVREGEYIGYGTSYMAHEKMKIAVVPIGYAHGYSRSLSNQGRVLIHGDRCAVVGTVNMNMIVIDVSELPNVTKGDEVVIIGSQAERTVSIASFSEYSNQLNYELLTRLPRNIQRKTTE